jgi:hypothetical protein
MSLLAATTIFVLLFIFLVASMFIQGTNKIEPPPDPSKINPNINKFGDGLFITNFENARDYNSLKKLGVRQILTVGKELPRHGEPFFKVMHVPIDDNPDENIKKYFNTSYNFIRHGPTVIHCAAGISRSATIAAAFLMRQYKLSASDALKHLKKCRSMINPNQGFVKQLRSFEKELNTAEGETN